MLAAHSGRGVYPKIRTFKQWDASTNSVFTDLKEAETWTGMEGKVDISELTWEQRERVLRLLFAKMNGHKNKPRYFLKNVIHFYSILILFYFILIYF